jgi:hypothetical protein
MEPSCADWIAIIISIFAFGVAAASAWYTRGQVKVSERARALEHDASWHAEWQRRPISGARLNESNGEYPMEWRLELRNIGNGPAYDLRVDLGGSASTSPRNLMPTEFLLLGATDLTPANLPITWHDRDQKPRKTRVPVPKRPVMPERYR